MVSGVRLSVGSPKKALAQASAFCHIKRGVKMEVLFIGNSFSDDASVYLHDIAKADGVKINAVNLYIGGCTLEEHYRNMLNEEKRYLLEVNGVMTGFKVSLKEALLNRSWDYVSFQQASHVSNNFDTYVPYITELSAYVKKLAPKAKQMIHQTWAYEEGSDRLKNLMGYENQAEMYNSVNDAYNKAAEAIHADMLVPSGKLFQMLIKEKVTPVHRDTFHASFGIGRYALALLWYKYLSQNEVINNTFSDFEEEISEENIKKIKECVARI